MDKEPEIVFFCWGDEYDNSVFINQVVYETKDQRLLYIDEIQVKNEKYKIKRRHYNVDTNEFRIYCNKTLMPLELTIEEYNSGVEAYDKNAEQASTSNITLESIGEILGHKSTKFTERNISSVNEEISDDEH